VAAARRSAREASHHVPVSSCAAPDHPPRSIHVPDRVTPTLPSRDLAATSAFYGRLGFREAFRDAGWLIVARGALQLECFPHPARDPRANSAGCCLRVDDARALHAAFGDAGVSTGPHGIPRLTPPVDQPWGFREFALVDPDGNLLRGLEPLGA
jgi:catechol 2,3-dioxygenase-like lactoylglutathione lyase family enzyme